MTRKSQFDAESWSTVVEAPALAAVAVVAAERGGTLRESVSLARAYAEAQKEGATELIEEVVGSAPALRQPTAGDRDALLRRASEQVGEAVEVVARTASADELEDYRRLVLDVADTVARAHKEGGFLGIGGTPVSDREQDALQAIAAAAGMPGR